MMAERGQGGQCTCNDPRCTVTRAGWQHCTKTENTVEQFPFVLWVFSLYH